MIDSKAGSRPALPPDSTPDSPGSFHSPGKFEPTGSIGRTTIVIDPTPSYVEAGSYRVDLIYEAGQIRAQRLDGPEISPTEDHNVGQEPAARCGLRSASQRKAAIRILGGNSSRVTEGSRHRVQDLRIVTGVFALEPGYANGRFDRQSLHGRSKKWSATESAVNHLAT